MLLLGVVALDAVASFADLLGDDVVGVTLDDPLDSGVLVARDQKELVAVGDDSLVLGRPDLDLAHAGGVVAFAVKGKGRVDAVLLRALVDPRVDLSEGLLVSGRTLREVHPRDDHAFLGSPPARSRTSLLRERVVAAADE